MCFVYIYEVEQWGFAIVLGEVGANITNMTQWMYANKNEKNSPAKI
jgi:hypothetical protein